MARPLAVCLSLCTSALIGCSAGGSGSGSNPPPISVSVSPNAATIDGTNPINLTATVANNPNNDGVTWTLGNTSKGTLSNATKTSVTYTAPAPASDVLTANITATSVADHNRIAVANISVPSALTFSATVNAIVGTPLSVQLKGSGGIPPYSNFTVTSGPLPPCLTLSPSGLLTSINGAAPTGSCVGEDPVDVQFTDSGTPTPLTSAPGELILTVARPTVSLTGNVPSTATVGIAYTSGSITAAGAAGAVTYAVTTGALPGGLSLNSSTGAISGTPTTVGIFNFFITGTDAYGDTSVLPSYQIAVNSANPDNALQGTYACVSRNLNTFNFDAFYTLGYSFTADGQGNITGGVGDDNESATQTGTLSGSYILARDGTGTATITLAPHLPPSNSSITRNWSILVQDSAAPATDFVMLETDNAANVQSNGAARCYLTNPSAFTAATLNHSFVYAARGHSYPGALEDTAMADAARFDVSSGIVASGYLETAVAGDAAPQPYTLTGRFETIDPTYGRVTLILLGNHNGASIERYAAVYFIDSTRALVVELNYGAGLPDPAPDIALVGELRTQQQSSWSAANASGPFVLYTEGSDITNSKGSFLISGDYSQILEGSADGQGNITLNRSFRNDSGTYTNSITTTKSTLAFDSANPGRATFVIGNATASLYFFDNNHAFELAGSSTSIELGAMEPQTQTSFSPFAFTGTYIVSRMAPIEASTYIDALFTPTGSGPATQLLDTVTSSSSSLAQTSSIDLVHDPAASTAGTFGLADSLTTGQSSCALITPTRFVCLPQNDASPYIFTGQQ